MIPAAMLALSDILARYLHDNQEYCQAAEVARANAEGRIWLVGGSVYRNLACQIYRSAKPSVDFDFIVEKSKEQYSLPRGWRQDINKYGNPKFTGPDYSIDFVPIESLHSIRRRQLEPSIANFLTGTPLTIQSICFDIEKKLLNGEIGVEAILSRTVKVNNKEQANIYAAAKGLSVEQVVRKKAASLDFEPIL